MAIQFQEIKDDTQSTVSGNWVPVENAGYGGRYLYAPAGSPSHTHVTWSFNGVEPGKYELYAFWIQHPNRATNVPFKLVENGTDTQLNRINQQLGPSAEFVEGFWWERLFTVNGFAGGSLEVLVGVADSDGYVIADSVGLVRADQQLLPFSGNVVVENGVVVDVLVDPPS